MHIHNLHNWKLWCKIHKNFDAKFNKLVNAKGKTRSSVIHYILMLEALGFITKIESEQKNMVYSLWGYYILYYATQNWQ